MLVVEGAYPASPGDRGCCALADSFLFVSQVTDLTRDLQHVFGTGVIGGAFGWGEENGIIYTCGLGFVDLAHLRDVADLTLYYHHLISKAGKNSADDNFLTFKHNGSVTLRQDIQPSEFLEVASSLAYDESVFHEIETYWRTGWGKHQSAFSPEDLVSNALGTYVARRAISAGGGFYTLDKFNASVTTELKALLTKLQPLKIDGTKAVLKKVLALGWIKDGSSRDTDYLQKRNFGETIVKPKPSIPPGVTECTIGPVDTFWLSPLLGTPQSYYVAKYTSPRPGGRDFGVLPSTVKTTDFAARIADIKEDARKRYGEDFALS